MDFLFHKLSEKEKIEIKKQAEEITESFSKKLAGIRGDIGESFIERQKSEREEDRKPAELDKKIMFENASQKNKDFIIAEKGKW